MENIIKENSVKFYANITFLFEVIFVKSLKISILKNLRKKKIEKKLPLNSKNYINNKLWNALQEYEIPSSSACLLW